MRTGESSDVYSHKERKAVAPPIDTDHVHVWRAYLPDRPITGINMLGWLDEDEKCALERFHSPADKDRCLFTHGALRNILSLYLGIRPEDIRYRYSWNGKPEIAGDNAKGLRFNMSHSRNVSLYAITIDSDVGVDIEYIDHKVPFMDIARAYFPPNDVLNLLRRDPEDAENYFFKLWARKEAYLKAVGAGLNESLLRVDMPEQDDGRYTMISGNDRYTILDLEISPDFTAAVAIKGIIGETEILVYPCDGISNY